MAGRSGDECRPGPPRRDPPLVGRRTRRALGQAHRRLFHYAIACYLARDHAAAHRVLDGLDVDPNTPDPAWPLISHALAAGALGDLGAMRAFMGEAVRAHRARRWPRPHAESDVLTGLAVVALDEGDHQRVSRHLATVAPIWYSPGGFVLWCHARDQVREHLDQATRQRCIEAGRSMSVEEAIDHELAGWGSEDLRQPAPGPSGTS